MTFQQVSISAAEALELVRKVADHAQSREWNVAVAVTDVHGNALASLRMDRAAPPILDFAQDKAYTAATMRRSTEAFAKRMAETSTFFNLVEVTPAADKEQRAQAISARTAMGYVHFPKDKPWVEKAVNELLAFPNGLHDDFVDAFAYVGLGLQSQIPVKRQTTTDGPAKYGTFRWVKEQQREADRAFSLSQNGGF